MKRISLVLLMIFISLGAFAQKDMDKMKSEKHSAKYADRVASELNLTADQKEKVQKAHMKMMEDKWELKGDHKKDAMANKGDGMAEESAEMREDRMKIQADFKEEMKDILDDGQYMKWESMYNKDMKNMKMHGQKDHKKMKSHDASDDDGDDDTDW